MEHKVTATRRRPKNFDLLIGQEFVKVSLSNSLSSGKVANAYLFSGPRGVGKTSTARLLAKALQNTNGIGIDNLNFDGADDIGKGQAQDVFEIDGASNTSVDDIRKIKENIQYSPQVYRYKIYIIDEVHMLSMSAFNALLKTIEEPPPYVVFIFATTEIHKVPITIKSRCQHFNFRLIPLSDVKEQLRLASEEEQITYEDEALLWIAKESGGSMRDAYTLFDQITSFCGKHITMGKIISKLSLVGMDRIDKLVSDMILSDNPKKVFETLDEIIASGISEEQLSIDFINYFRSMLLLKNNITNANIIGYDLKYFSKKVLDELDESQLQKILEMLFSYYRNLRSSVSQRFELELLISKIIHIKKYISNFEMFNIARHVQKMITSASIVNLAVAKDTNAKDNNSRDSNDSHDSRNEIARDIARDTNQNIKEIQQVQKDVSNETQTEQKEAKDNQESQNTSTQNSVQNNTGESASQNTSQNTSQEVNSNVNSNANHNASHENTESGSKNVSNFKDKFLSGFFESQNIESSLHPRFSNLKIENTESNIAIKTPNSITYDFLQGYKEALSSYSNQTFSMDISIEKETDFIKEAIAKHLGIKSQ